MTHPGFARLDAAGCRSVDADALNAFIAGPGHRVLLVTGDPTKRPEAVDAAVILVELLREFPAFAAARATGEAEVLAQTRLGAAVLPCLLFFRDGAPVGKLPGVKDWDVYRAAFMAQLAPAAA